LKKIGRNVFDLIVPEKAQDMRLSMNLCIYKSSPFKLIPIFFLMGFVQVSFLIIALGANLLVGGLSFSP